VAREFPPITCGMNLALLEATLMATRLAEMHAAVL
jgi:hypothetical protein